MSHRKIKALWLEGALSMAQEGGDVQPVIALRRTYVFAQDEVFVHGNKVPKAKGSPHVWMLHKPKGVVSTLQDPQGRRSLVSWTKELSPGTFPVGRLDRETTGLILLTNDGDLTFLVLSPEFHVSKRYELWVQGELEEGDERLSALRCGVDIGDDKGLAVADEVLIHGHDEGVTHLSLELHEGRNRQVRKMCRVARLRLVHLHRSEFGGVSLGELEQGEVRELTENECESLWQRAGGRDVPYTRGLAALRAHASCEREQERPPLLRVERWLDELEEDKKSSGMQKWPEGKDLSVAENKK